MYAHYRDEKLLLLTIIARWEAKVCKFFVTGKVATKVERQDFSQSRQASAPAQARRHTHARSPRQMQDSVRIRYRRDGLPVMGPAVQTLYIERVCIHNLCHRGYSLLRLKAYSTGCGTTNLFPVLFCVALDGFAASCEDVCLLLAVAQ